MSFKRKPRTTLLGFLPQIFSKAIGFDEDRRQFIKKISVASAAIAISGFAEACKNLEKPLNVSVIGAGMSGLYSAYLLKKAGIDVTVYEASIRTGGRMYSAQNLLGEGLTTEMGGEFLDSTHLEMLGLAKKFGFELIDTSLPSEALLKPIYYFNGKNYTFDDLVKAFKPYAKQIAKDIEQIPENFTYQNAGKAKEFDQFSITQYLEKLGINGVIKDYLTTAFTTEYGLDASEQSVLNMFILLGTDTSDPGFSFFQGSDERYKIRGGNQQIPDALAKELQNEIKTSHSLTKIKSIGNKFELHLDNRGKKIIVQPDYVVMSLPFSVLRTIDITEANFSELKLKAINELGYGKNAKLMIGFNSKFWRSQGFLGTITSNSAIQCCWDNSQLQAAQGGGLTIFTGGKASDALAVSGSPEDIAAPYIKNLDAFFKGASKEYNGKAARFHWQTYPFAKASYSCYLPNQWTTFGGIEGQPESNMFFVGEHCSIPYQGFMNGAAETGRLAAEAILAKVKK